MFEFAADIGVPCQLGDIWLKDVTRFKLTNAISRTL